MTTVTGTRFIDPRGRSGRIRSAFAAVAAGVGGALLIWSSGEAGLTQDGLISGGMAALAFAALGLLVQLQPEDEGWAFWYRKFFNTLGFYAGIGAIIGATQTDSSWAQTFLLELGVAVLFISGVEILLDHLVADAHAAENEERQIWEELLLRGALAFNLSAWEHHEVQAALDETPGLRWATAADRTALVLTYARNASAISPGLEAQSDIEFKAVMRRHVRAMTLAASAAQLQALSDPEFFYLLNVATVRSDPTDERYSEEVDRDLPTWVNEAAALIRQNRPRGWRRWVDPELPDSLAAADGVSAYHTRGFATTVRALAPRLDRSLLEDPH